MKIYTKTGDTGETGLFSGKRVSKDDPSIEAYGTVDELNAVLGIAYEEISFSNLKEKIRRVQFELFEIGADLATPLDSKNASVKRDHQKCTECFEHEIDEMEKELKPLKNFILPGGTKASALLHLARTVCRRAERETIQIVKNKKANTQVLIYLNRLSDWLFVAARYANHLQKTDDIPWIP